MPYQPTAETLAIVRRLGGMWSGDHAMVRCPAHEDGTPSLSIRQGRISILVHCFAGCNGADIMRAIRQILGASVGIQHSVACQADKPSGLAGRLWNEALPVEGTLAQRYLRDIRGIRFVPPDVGFHERCPMGKGALRQCLPALLVGVFRRTRLVAVQRQFLDPKTGERTCRMMLGRSRGGIWPSRLSGQAIAIAEGFESACAYRQTTGREAGTCFGAGNFASFEPPFGVTHLTLLPDNDPQGFVQAHRGAALRRGHGETVTVGRCPPPHGDWGDMIRPGRVIAG